MYTGAALSFGLIRACRGGLVLYCSVLSDAGGENDGNSAIFERSLLYCFKNVRIPKQHAVCEILCNRIKLPTSRYFNGTNSDPQPASRPASGPFG